MKSYLFMAALAVSATAASASVIPVLDNASPVDLGNGTFAYTYSATLASQAALATGNYFTLYDFGDFVSVSATPANWSFTTANVGLTPADTLPEDDAAITNITFTYNGPALNYEENGPFSEISF